MIAGNTYLHLFLATTLILAGTMHVVLRARKLWTITMVDVAILMYSVYFGLGPWVAFLYGEYTLPDISGSTLMVAYLSIWLFLAGLWGARRVLSRHDYIRTEQGDAVQVLGRVCEAIRRTASTPLVVIFVAYAFVIIVRVALASNYGILYSGTENMMTEITLPYGFVAARSLSNVVGMGLLIWASTAVWSRDKRTIPAVAVLVMESIFAFTQGRRQLLLFTITLCLTYFVMRGKLLLRHIIIGAVAMYFLWTIFMPAFFTVRSALVNKHMGNALVTVFQAISDYIHGEILERQSWDYARNMASRPLIISFNVQIISSQDFVPLLWGRATWNSILFATPRVLLPVVEKPDMSEVTIQRHYGLRVTDMANNWPAVAIADFGLFGSLVYGVLFGSILIMFEWTGAAVSGRLPFVAACFVGAVLSLAFMVEQGPEFTWNQIRDCTLILICGFIGGLFIPGRRRQLASEEAYLM